jgi:hypothetical protein
VAIYSFLQLCILISDPCSLIPVPYSKDSSAGDLLLSA